MYFGIFFSPIKFSSVVLLLHISAVRAFKEGIILVKATYTTVTAEVCDITSPEHAYLTPTAHVGSAFFFFFFNQKVGRKSAVDLFF